MAKGEASMAGRVLLLYLYFGILLKKSVSGVQVIAGWQRIQPSPGQPWPSPRSQAATCLDAQDDWWVLGGRSSSDLLHDLWMFSSTDFQWNQFSPTPEPWPGGALCVSLAVAVAVGVDGSISVLNRDNGTWVQLNNSSPVEGDKFSWWCNDPYLWLMTKQRLWRRALTTDAVWQEFPSHDAGIVGDATWSLKKEGSLYLLSTNDRHLWMRNEKGWRAVDQGLVHPPPRLGSATWVDSAGNLWMFGGKNETGMLLNDTWMYDVQDALWREVITINTPSGRVDASAWYAQDTAFVFGGRNCSAEDCFFNDLWRVNVSLTEDSNTSSTFYNTPNNSSVNLTTVPTKSKSKPDKNSRSRSWQEETGRHVFGSIIFFGISLSIFTVFGIVLFVRRCVTCPPNQHVLLKEPPPVRYTVIPDDAAIA